MPLDPIEKLIQSGIDSRVFPGAAWVYGRKDRIALGARGNFTYSVESPTVETSTIWDLASVTKVVCTTMLAMIAFDLKLISLEDKVTHYLPTFGANGKSAITLRHLLLHNSGLAPYREFHQEGIVVRDGILGAIDGMALDAKPGMNTAYSCLGFITLARCLEVAFGSRLDEAFDKYVARPLNLNSTFFCPKPQFMSRIAPTEHLPTIPLKMESEGDSGFDWNGERYIRGTVHDETAFLLGGVSGNAGLFASAEDLGKFGQSLLDLSASDLSLPLDSTLQMFGSRQSMDSSRGLGWDTKSLAGDSSAGHLFGNHSFGHLGFTGTSIWIDRESGVFCALMNNRVHPNRLGPEMFPIRAKFADLAFAACLNL